MTDLEVEEEEFNDLAVFDFTDSYRNLTIKRLVSFHFALKVFNTSFFFNVDDDMYVNFRAVFHLLSGYREGQGVMAGYCPTGVSVTRNRRSKWFVSEDNFPEPAFPPVLLWICLHHLQVCDGGGSGVQREGREPAAPGWRGGGNPRRQTRQHHPPTPQVVVDQVRIQRELLPGQLHHARTQTSTNLQHVELLQGQTAHS